MRPSNYHVQYVRRVWHARTTLPILALLIACALVGAGCGATPTSTAGATQSPGAGSSSAPSTTVSTIGLTTSNFTTHSATVQAGQPITLDDTVNGGAVHILCVGSGSGGQGSSKCDAASQAPNAPADLVGQGMTITPGQKKQVTFMTTGSYHVICTVHPGMYINITVK